MANKAKTMIQIRRVLQLLEQGLSARHISKELSIALNTVKKYRTLISQSGLTTQQLSALDDAGLQLIVYPVKVDSSESLQQERQRVLNILLPDYISRLQTTHITRELLWQEYRGQNPQGYGYSQFCQHLQDQQLIHKAVMHLEHKPGETLQIDFAGDKLSYVDHLTGEIIRCPVLVCTMPYSNFCYIEALSDQSQPNLIEALNNCLWYLGGVPHSIKSDNLKQVVNKPDRYEPVLSELIDQFALHYKASFCATRVVKPRDKASVERHVGIAYTQIYAIVEQKTLHSLKQLNQEIRQLLDALNNKIMQKKLHSRRQLFEQMERPLLGKLPETTFEIKYQTSAKVMRDYHVILGKDWHHYSVPYQYIGKQVEILYNQTQVEIYHNLQRIALHERTYRKHGYSTLEMHMPSNHKAAKQAGGYTAEYFLCQAQNIGAHTHQAIKKVLEARFFTEQTYNSCLGILRLKDKYTPERLEKACQIALSVYKANYRFIHTILQNNRDKSIDLQTISYSTPTNHANVRGNENYRLLFDQNLN